jgi:hypothetical protein
MQFVRSGKYIALKAPSRLISRLELTGVSYDDDQVRFDAKYYDEGLATIAAAAITGNPILVQSEQLRSRKRYEPGQEELDLINAKHKQRKEDYGADDLFIYERYPANNLVSRSVRLRFTERALAKMARDATEGRSRIMHHYDAAVVGRTVFGEVVKETIRGHEGAYLRTVEYIPRTDGKAEIISDVESGILSYDSVGVVLGSATEYLDMEDENGPFSILQIDFNSDDRRQLELNEISFVHLGELRGVGSKNKSDSGMAVDVSGNLTGSLLERAEAALAAGATVSVSGSDRVEPPKSNSNAKYSEIIWRSF